MVVYMVTVNKRDPMCVSLYLLVVVKVGGYRNIYFSESLWCWSRISIYLHCTCRCPGACMCQIFRRNIDFFGRYGIRYHYPYIICTGNVFLLIWEIMWHFDMAAVIAQVLAARLALKCVFGDVLSWYKRDWLDYTMWLNKLFEWGLSNVYENRSVKHYYTVGAFGTRYSDANGHMTSS